MQFRFHDSLLFGLSMFIVMVSNSVSGQEAKIPSDLRIVFAAAKDSSSKRDLVADIQRLERLDYNQIDSADLWLYHLHLSCRQALLSKLDANFSIPTASDNLNLALSYDRSKTCNVLCVLNGSSRRALHGMGLHPDERYFYLDVILSQGASLFFEESCSGVLKRDCTPMDLEPDESKPEGYEEAKEIIRTIYHRDQDNRRRKDLEWSELRLLDSINRWTIDSLLDAGLVLSASTAFELLTMSLVLHHSDDWNWNKKWFDLLLSLKLFHPDKEIFFLGLAIDRHLNLNNGGSCDGKQCDEIKAYKQYLIDKYPAYLCDGYNIRLDE